MQIEILSMLSKSEKYERCIDWATDMMGLPEPRKGGALILAMSKHNWSNAGDIIRVEIDKIEKTEAAAGMFASDPSRSLFSQVSFKRKYVIDPEYHICLFEFKAANAKG
jgi:hypothetical protein